MKTFTLLTDRHWLGAQSGQMNESETRQIMSRLSNDDFIGREVELARVCALVQNNHGGSAHSSASNGLLLGAPRAGKTEILRKSFDRLFNEKARLAFLL
jgi:hypothetical protein